MKRMKYGDGNLYSGVARKVNFRRKIITCLTILAVSAAVLAGCDKDDDDDGDGTGTNETDVQFVTMASMSNYAEIKAGQVAANKAQNQGVKQFGQMMVTDHTTASTQLKTLATQLGLQAKDSLDEAHVRLMDSLNTLSGIAFDSVYISSQVVDHQKAIALFQNQAENGRNSELKKFAGDLLPHLEIHLHHADSLKMSLQQQ